MPDANGVSAIPSKILVPIDFSPSSHTALETAMELGQKLNAGLILLHVLPELASEELKAQAEKNFSVSKAALDAKGIQGKTIVAVVPSSSERYLSTWLFADVSTETDDISSLVVV